jgi:hypothetical protein
MTVPDRITALPHFTEGFCKFIRPKNRPMAVRRTVTVPKAEETTTIQLEESSPSPSRERFMAA